MDKPIVAVLGLGIMGRAMARRLLDAGYPVRVWNRSPDKTRALVEAGAKGADDPAEAAVEADVVLTMLSDGDAVQTVMSEARGALKEMKGGAIWAQMSTVGDEWADRFGEMVKGMAPKVRYVDAPVLGTKQPAEQGKLTIVASGPDDARAVMDPIFDVLGQRTLWVGEAGMGNRVKIVVNSWLVGLVGALAETLRVSRAVGVDPEVFLDAIHGGPIDAPFAQLKGKLMLSEDFEAAFPLKHALKDARLALDAASRGGVHAAVAEAVATLFQKAQDAGHGDEDLSAVYTVAAQ